MNILRTHFSWSQVALLMVGLGGLAAPVLAAAPPNVVLVIADDVGWQDLGVLGSDIAETPNLDRLAGEGTLFTQAYSNGPNCPVARASLLTGQYPTHHGVFGAGNLGRGEPGRRLLEPPFNREVLPPSLLTFAEVLRPAGYATGYIGKWQLGEDPAFGPRSQGFDVSIAAGNSVRPQSQFSPYGLPELSDGPVGEYLTDRLTNEAIAFIETNRGRPFLLVLSHYAAHPPLQAEAATTAKYSEKLSGTKGRTPAYFAMIEAIDRSAGRLFDALGSHGLAQNTLFVFLGDNGPALHVTTLAPLRGSKGLLNEGGLRIPMFVRWPAHAKASHRVDTPVLPSDVYPTILAATGAAPPVGHVIDGENLLPLLEGSGGLTRQAIYWHFPGYIETGLPNRSYRMKPTSAMRLGKFKLFESLEDGRVALYDLASDPGERHNILYQQESKVAEMKAMLAQWRTQQRAAMPTKRDAATNPGESRP